MCKLDLVILEVFSNLWFYDPNEMNNFQTPDSKRDKSLTPKTPKIPLSLEEIKAKMQASVDKVSSQKLHISLPYFYTSTYQKNGMFLRNVTNCCAITRVYWYWSSERRKLSWDKKKPLYLWEMKTSTLVLYSSNSGD